MMKGKQKKERTQPASKSSLCFKKRFYYSTDFEINQMRC